VGVMLTDPTPLCVIVDECIGPATTAAGIALVEYLSVGDVTTDRRVLENRVNLVIGQPRKQRAAPEDLPSFWCRPNQSATS